MSSLRISKNLKHYGYFLTLTVHNWYYLFDRFNRFEILLNSLIFCQKNKNLQIFNYVFMLNHIHLIVKSQDVIGFIRDFKSFTSKEIRKNIEKNEPHILPLFVNNGKYSFWQKNNMPKLLESDEFYLQKAAYIENNPVKKGYVVKPEYWQYSSANKEKPLIELACF